MGTMKIGAIIITYNPDEPLLKAVVGSLTPQVQMLLVIDNGSSSPPAIPDQALSDGNLVRTVLLKENRGIATATNIGLRMLAERRFDFIITSDQDTVYPSDYVTTFARLLEGYPGDMGTVAAFAPVFYDKVVGKTISAEVKCAIGSKKVFPSEAYLNVIQTIASGMILNAALLDEVGGMREELFIDCVDTEWCWRANALGKKIVCCRDLKISHRLGDGMKRLGPKRITLHSPIRNYYITRNSIYLALHTRYFNLTDRILMFIMSLRFIPLYTLLCPGHFQNLRYTFRGLLDAFRGRMGKYGSECGIPGPGGTYRRRWQGKEGDDASRRQTRI